MKNQIILFRENLLHILLNLKITKRKKRETKIFDIFILKINK